MGVIHFVFGSGCPNTNNTARCVTKLARFHGCMQQIFIDDEPVDIDVLLQRKWARYTELLLGTCGITDRCVQFIPVWVHMRGSVMHPLIMC